MWQLDDRTKYMLVGRFHYSKAVTHSSGQDKERREAIRKDANEQISQEQIIQAKHQAKWWAFRLFIQKKLTEKNPFDIENAAKLVIDAFSGKMIQKDQSKYKHLELFDDDSLLSVRVVEIAGKPAKIDQTLVEIYGALVDEMANEGDLV